jgi:polysaccharide biosynthesis/export protein
MMLERTGDYYLSCQTQVVKGNGSKRLPISRIQLGYLVPSMSLVFLAIAASSALATTATATALPPARSMGDQVSPDNLEETYSLGAGDRLQIAMFNIPELSGEFRVSVDGYLNLPWIGTVAVAQMTLKELKLDLASRYRRFLKRPPVINLTLLSPRPVRVSVSGQVNNPGSYTTAVEAPQDVRGNLQWPTLTQALQTAGGITQLADVREVQVRRLSRDGSTRMIVDLWELLDAGDSSQDLSLRDGDAIFIPKAKAINSSESVRLGTANFSPKNIKVQVVGEVVKPGSVEIPTNSSLNQAILVAGGFNNTRAKQTAVDFIRLNLDGTVTQRTIQVNLSAAPNDKDNPILRSNDVIVAQRSDTAKSADRVGALGGILNPVSGILSVLRLLLGK